MLNLISTSPAPTPQPVSPSFDSGGDGYSSTISGTISSTGKVTFGTATDISGVSFPAGTTGTVILDSEPAGVTAPENSYAVYDLSAPSFKGHAQIEFSVPAALLTDRGLTVYDVGLRHFTGGKLVTLTTYYVSEERGAATPSLSPFAIVYEQGGAETIEYATPEPTVAAPVTGTQNVTAQSAVIHPARGGSNEHRRQHTDRHCRRCRRTADADAGRHLCRSQECCSDFWLPASSCGAERKKQ